MKTLRTFSLILSLCLAMSANAYDVYVDGIYYNLVPKAKQASVTWGENQYVGDIVIPKNITSEGIVYSVTCIESRTFGSKDNISSIEIPNSITTIKDGAFGKCI